MYIDVCICVCVCAYCSWLYLRRGLSDDIIRFSTNREKMEKKTVYCIEKKKGHGSQKEYTTCQTLRGVYIRVCVCEK